MPVISKTVPQAILTIKVKQKQNVLQPNVTKEPLQVPQMAFYSLVLYKTIYIVLHVLQTKTNTLISRL